MGLHTKPATRDRIEDAARVRQTRASIAFFATLGSGVLVLGWWLAAALGVLPQGSPVLARLVVSSAPCLFYRLYRTCESGADRARADVLISVEATVDHDRLEQTLRRRTTGEERPTPAPGRVAGVRAGVGPERSEAERGRT